MNTIPKVTSTTTITPSVPAGISPKVLGVVAAASNYADKSKSVFFNNYGDAIAYFGNSTTSFLAGILQYYFTNGGRYVRIVNPGAPVVTGVTTTLNESGGVVIGETTITVASGTSFSQNDWIKVGTGNSECMVKILSKTGNDLSISPLPRAQVNGANVVKVTYPVQADYEKAIDTIVGSQDVDIVVTDQLDNSNGSLISYLKSAVVTASLSGHELISVYGDTPGETQTNVKNLANTLNSDCMVALFNPVLDEFGGVLHSSSTAGAVAGNIASRKDFKRSFNWCELKGFYGTFNTLSEAEMNSLLSNGVCPVSVDNGKVKLVRAVTTYYQDETGLASDTREELIVKLISDYVVRTIRTTIRENYGDKMNTSVVRDAVQSSVNVILTVLKKDEVIEEYSPTVVSTSPEEPTKINVRFGFKPIKPLNQIDIYVDITI